MKIKIKYTRWFLLIIPVLAILGILTYYQLFYKAKTVNNGMMNLVYRFQQHKHNVTSVRFLPGDSLMVTSSVDSSILIWRKTTGEILRSIKQNAGISYMDVSEDGNYILTGGYDSKLRLWDTNTGILIKEMTGHTGTVWTVAFSKDGKYIASSGDDKLIIIWNRETGKIYRRFEGHKRIVWAVKFSPDGVALASGSFDHTLKLWNIESGKLVWDEHGHDETVVDVAFSHDGKLLASVSDDKTIKLWNWKEKKLIRTMKRAEHVQAVVFSADDKSIMAGGRDKPMIGEFLQSIFGDSKFNPGVSAYLWDVATGELLHTITEHYNDVMDIDFSSDNKWVATASADKSVCIWKVEQ